MRNALLILVGVCWVLLQGLAAGHDKSEADLNDHDSHSCAVCTLSDRTDEDLAHPALTPDPTINRRSTPMRAFAAQTLIVPTVWPNPPGRAPPHA